MNFEIIKIPDSVKIIGQRAFMNCQKLKTVEFSENSQLETIGSEAFKKSAIETFNSIEFEGDGKM